ncbi:MAG: hypothetical protein JST08_17750 [Actinobacteria bacterium]|nr:hypothetical protein [Actinomycetota bacterium]
MSPVPASSWSRTTYVVTDAFDAALFTLAQHAQAAREGGDYEAVKPSRPEAERYVVGAGDFIAAVERMLDAGDQAAFFAVSSAIAASRASKSIGLVR